MTVNHERRSAIRANHSATHLLHAALRERLGTHVTQKGSVVDEKRLRFDIAHPKAVTPEEIKTVEARVNEEIRANTDVITRLMPVEEAIESGAMALFGEKYDDEVRVLTMGREKDGKPFSVELCGGTHVSKTGDIGKIKIISEGAVSAGVRRLVALTGAAIDDYLTGQEQAQQEKIDKLKAETQKLRDELISLGGTAPATAVGGEDDLIAHNKTLQKQISELRRKQGAETSDDDIKVIGSVKFTAKVLDGFPAKDLKPMVDDLKKKIGSGVITLIATDDGKASIVVGVTDDLTAKISAVELVKKGVEVLGGKGGGGRPDMAQGGGPNAAAANDAVTAIENALAS